MRQIVDMPEIQANRFLKLCHGNNGVLSNNKRKSQFSELSDDEVHLLQEAIRLAYLDSDPLNAQPEEI
jgi:hypothetical protein